MHLDAGEAGDDRVPLGAAAGQHRSARSIPHHGGGLPVEIGHAAPWPGPLSIREHIETREPDSPPRVSERAHPAPPAEPGRTLPMRNNVAKSCDIEPIPTPHRVYANHLAPQSDSYVTVRRWQPMPTEDRCLPI